MSIFKTIAKELSLMVRADQEAAVDPEYWNGAERRELVKKNTERLKEIIAEYGWPTISKVGAIPCSEAWLIVQHADHDLDFQKEVLSIFKSLPEGEVSKYNLAMLEDRIRKNSGLPQTYGTQWVVENNKQVPYKIEDPENVEERRRKMGLETMEENLKNLQKWSKVATKKLKEKK